MRYIVLSLFVVGQFVTPSIGAAHGPQIQITADGGKIVTREILLDSPYGNRLSDPKSAYVIPLKEYLGVWYTRPSAEPDAVLNAPKYYSGPGIAYGYGYDAGNPASVGFEVGSQLRIDFTSGLKRWDGAAFVDAGVTELEVFRGSFASPSATGRTSDAAPFDGVAYAPIEFAAEGADAHNVTRFRLLGDGLTSTSVSLDGVYLATLQFSSDQSGLAPSDPFYFVMPKNAAADEVAAAVASLGLDANLVQYVPEPVAIVLGVVCLAQLASVSRSQKRGPSR